MKSFKQTESDYRPPKICLSGHAVLKYRLTSALKQH